MSLDPSSTLLEQFRALPSHLQQHRGTKEELPLQSPLLISLMFTLIFGRVPAALATAPKDTQARNRLPDKGWE